MICSLNTVWLMCVIGALSFKHTVIVMVIDPTRYSKLSTIKIMTQSKSSEVLTLTVEMDGFCNAQAFRQCEQYHIGLSSLLESHALCVMLAVGMKA